MLQLTLKSVQISIYIHYSHDSQTIFPDDSIREMLYKANIEITLVLLLSLKYKKSFTSKSNIIETIADRYGINFE